MIVVLSDEHKKDLAFIKELSIDFFGEFCKLAAGFLQKGTSDNAKKMFAGAAKKLGVTAVVIERGIAGLCYLWTQATKLRLSENDFNDSLAVLGFAAEFNEILKKLYTENSAEWRKSVNELDFDLAHYTDFDWRLDIQVASRASRNLMNPMYIINLETEQGGQKKTETLQTDVLNMKHLAQELEAALNTMKAQYARRVDRNI